MNTSIHKSDRSYKYHQKGLRGEITKTKQQASKDITADCIENPDYEKNYIPYEYQIMRYLKDRINFDFVV